MTIGNAVSADDLLRTYSIASESGSEIIFPALMRLSADDVPIKSKKADRLLERFPVESPFGDILQKAISTQGTSITELSEQIKISENLLGQVISHSELPNIMPVKKMKMILDVLHIPLQRAVESMRSSLIRVDLNQAFVPLSVAAQGRSGKRSQFFKSSERSSAALKRRLDAYIERLFQEYK